jgi:hypothetical protein
VHLLAGSLHDQRARAFRQKLVVGKSCTSVIIIDAEAQKRLQDGQPEITLPYIISNFTNTI